MAPFSAHVNGNVIKCSTRNRIAPNATDALDTAGESFLGGSPSPGNEKR